MVTVMVFLSSQISTLTLEMLSLLDLQLSCTTRYIRVCEESRLPLADNHAFSLIRARETGLITRDKFNLFYRILCLLNFFVGIVAHLSASVL